MRALNIADDGNRDSHVAFEPVTVKTETGFRTDNGGKVRSVKVIKNTMESNLAHLKELAEKGGSEPEDLIIAGDPEVDFRYMGKISSSTRTIYIDESGRISYNVRFQENIYSPEGELTETRDMESLPANIAVDWPLRWSKKFVPVSKAVKMFVFSKVYQLRHVNGLTYDFLYRMAEVLHKKQAFMLIGAGKAGKEPLRFHRGGLPYRAFLRGRVKGESYCLTLHLTNLELKAVHP
ncbi:MAG: hypothetical protein QNK37_19340 [Acidobacteriota bacterium]|nr:hypothetical protein [Acidobacteriota bacterium]